MNVIHTPQALKFTASQVGTTSTQSVLIRSAPFDCDITATVIDPSSSSSFQVTRIVKYDAVRGPNGWPSDTDWTETGESDGIDPLRVTKKDFIEVDVLLRIAGHLGDNISATLEVQGKSTAGQRWSFLVPMTVQVEADFWLTGLEVIQSVQTPDNAVPLIGNKTTYIRAYVQSDQPTNISGHLITTDSKGHQRSTEPTTPTISASPQGSQRSAWSQSLNFRLDDDLVSPGSREFKVIVFSPSTGPVATPQSNRAMTLECTFRPRIDLHIYGVVWAVTNTNDGQGAPIGPAAPWSDFEEHRRYVENVFPVSTLTIDPVPGIGTQAPNPQTFGNLLESRAWATAESAKLPPLSNRPTSSAIVNLLDNWETPGLHGYAWDGACEEQNARGIRVGHVMAQEVAHRLGLWWHTFTPGTPYPRSSGAIGANEICLDLTASEPTLIDGSATAYDIMSYASPPPKNWASAFTYGKLIDAINNR